MRSATGRWQVRCAQARTLLPFQWRITVVKIKLIGSADEKLVNCQKKMNKYLESCVTITKLIDSTGIFQYWNQCTINAFYKYCKDNCVVPRVDQKGRKLKLFGFVNSLSEVGQKWSILSNLAKENILRTPPIARPGSAITHSGRPGTGSTTARVKVYNIMLSYCQQDARKCQRLLSRLAEEGLSLWAEPARSDQQREVTSQIDKSDCVILCTSEMSGNNQSCEKEARYAFQQGKPVFLAKMEHHSLWGWQREVFAGKLFSQLYGSSNHFDLQFGTLLLKIVSHVFRSHSITYPFVTSSYAIQSPDTPLC